MNYLVVGCGISGATLGRLLAEKGHKVTIIDSRDEVAGNCYDYFDDDGIDVHKYGTHIFHTDIEPVWKFLSRFTKWYPFQHRVLALIDGQEVPLPFNLNSIHQVFPEKIAATLEEKLLEKFGFNRKVPILELRKTGDKDLQFLADYIYEKVFLHYTLKQWGMKPEDLDPAVTGRVPVYVGRDNRYFYAKYQGIPLEGYTKLVKKMLRHEGIKVHLKTSFTKEMAERFDHVFYTGPIDEYFDYKYGELPYRSLRFDFIRFDRPYFQDNSVINYPCNYDFTRIGEYKYFLGTKSKRTVVSYEYPQAFVRGENERYYPIVRDENIALYKKYREEADREAKVTFFGRLGDYKYYDIDKSVNRAIEIASQY